MDKEKVVNTLKQTTEKGLEVSKQALHSVKDTTKKVIAEEKEKYHENRIKGVDNFDDKLKKWLVSISPSATFAKWRMNRVMNGYRKEEDEEKGISTESNLSLVFQIFKKFGIAGYAAFFGILVVIVLIILNYLLDLLPYVPFLLFLKYVHIHYKYSRNGRHFDWYWFINLIKEDYSYRPTSITDTYYTIPLALYITDNELENYLEKRGKKDMVSKQREYASISNSRIEFDEKYGWIRIFQIDNRFFKKSVNSLEDVELTDYFIIPQTTSNHELNSNVYYAVHNEVRQSISHLIGMKSVEDFISRIVNDSSINAGFGEIAEQLQEQRQKELEEEKIRKEQMEQQQLEQVFRDKGLNDKAIKIITRLKKNQENWGISIRDLFGKSMEFSKNYLKVRADLMGDTTFKKVVEQSSKIGQKTGIIPKILKAENASAVYLLFVLNEDIKGRKVRVEDIKKEANEGYLTVGEGILGTVKVEFPRGDSPSFGLIGGLSRSGKSTLGTMMFTAMAYLNDNKGNYDYSDFFIASVKDEDYIANGYKNSGMLVVSDVFEIYNMLKLVDKIATDRKEEFLEIGTINISQYNKKSTSKMGKIMVIMDEYANTLSKASNYKVETDAGNIDLSKAIEALVVKIAQEHGSRGVSLFILTQQFSKGAIGDAADVLGSRFLGYAKENVWQSQDPSKQVSAYLKDMEDTTEARRGRFFISAPDFGFTGDTRVLKIGQEWTEVKTNYADTEEYFKNFDRTFQTAEKYLDKILQKNILDENLEEEEEVGVDPY